MADLIDLLKALGVGIGLIIGGLSAICALFFVVGLTMHLCGFFADVPAMLIGMMTTMLAIMAVMIFGMALALGDSFLNEVIRGNKS